MIVTYLVISIISSHRSQILWLSFEGSFLLEKSRHRRKLQSGSVHPLLDALLYISDLFINFFHICLEGTIGAEITKQSILHFTDPIVE